MFIDESLPFLEDLSDSTYPDNMTVSMYECSGSTRGDDGYVREQDGFGYTSGDDCSDIDDITFETHKFLQNDGFYLLSQPVEPWRTEVMINGEGDLQLTVHHALPDGEDFRFMFSIDPYFRPTLCTTDAQGNPKVEYLDGSDWVDRWSENEEDYNIYYLNAGAYQLNPSDTDDYWFLTTDMSSGFGNAKFSAEEFNSIPTAYGNYDEDGGGDDFMFVEDRSDVDFSGYDSAVSDLEEQALVWQDERAITAGASIDGTPAFEHKVEGNQWRPVNASAAGLDGWGEVHSSWVRSLRVLKSSLEVRSPVTSKSYLPLLNPTLRFWSRVPSRLQTCEKMLGLILFSKTASVLKTTQHSVVVQSWVNSLSTAKNVC